MSRLRIISDGRAVVVKDADTGEVMRGIKKVTFVCEAGEKPYIVVEMEPDRFDVVAEVREKETDDDG